MANISDKIAKIRNAILGKEVRDSIADGVEGINAEVQDTTNKQNLLETEFDQLVINAGDSNAEIVQSRVGEDGTPHESLKKRIDTEVGEVKSQLAETTKVINAETYSSLVDAITELNVTTKRTFYIPEGQYIVNSSLEIDESNVDIQLSPNTKIIQSNPFISTFIVNGENCSIYGGTIEYPLTFNGENIKWTDNDSVILVKGNGFKAKNICLNNIYKVGIGIRGASDFIISENTIEGNYPPNQWTGVETAHFGIAIDPSVLGGGENGIITNNIIKSCVQGVFVGNYGQGVGYGINISHNIFDGCHNHGIYSNGGVGTILNGNSFNRCSLPIAIHGKYATITNNNLFTHSTGDNIDLAGISVREASHCNISHNTIKGDAPNNAVIIDVITLSENVIDNNIIHSNIIDVEGGSAIGIRLGSISSTIECFDNQIKDNIIRVNGRTGQGIISVLANDDNNGSDNHIIGNTITVLNNTYAIHHRRQNAINISSNTIKLEYNAPTSEVLTLINGIEINESIICNNSLFCRDMFGENIALRGYREDVGSNGNLVTNNLVNLTSPLLTSKTPIFVNDTSVANNNLVEGVIV